MTETAAPAAPSLPPIGMIGSDDHADVAGYIYNLVQEAVEGRDGWVEEADRNIKIYTYGAEVPADDDTIIVFDVQNDVQAITDIQTKEPPAIALEPVERGDKPVCFYAGPQNLGIGLFQFETNQVADWIDPQTQSQQPPMPLDEDQADALRDAIDSGGVPIAGPAGQPVMKKIKPDWLVEVDGQFVADFYQSLFDVYWRRSGFDEAVRANLLSTNILGWTLWLYEFDGEQQIHLFREMSIRQVYIDPTVRDIRLAAYAGVELVLDRDEATKLYPEIADEIEAHAQIGIPVRSNSLVTLGQAVDRNFRRPTISMTIMWLRNQECPHTPEQAMEKGLIEQRGVPDEAAIAAMTPPAPPAEGEGTTAGLAEMVGDAPYDQANQPGEDAQERDDVDDRSGSQSGDEADKPVRFRGSGNVGDDSDAVAGGNGEEPGGGISQAGNGADDFETTAGGGAGGELPPVPTRPAHFLPGSDEEIDPAHPAWPTYRCIRQIKVIAGRVVDDRESKFKDIPILHNVNRPIPQRPWGIGEPYVLWKLARAKSRVLGAMVENAEFYGAPASAMSQSMAASLEERYDDCHIKPGVTMIVEDQLYQQMNGQIHTLIPPPQMPDGLMKVYPILSKEIDDISGYTEALQGQASPEVTSGKHEELLQQAGSSIIGFKSARTGDMVTALAHECLNALLKWVSVDDILKVNRKYPRHIVEAVVKLAQELEWNISVTVTSGNGAVKRQKKQEAGQDLALGATSLRSYQEAAGIDSAKEDQRKEAEAEKQARLQSRLQPPQPIAPPNPPKAQAARAGASSG